MNRVVLVILAILLVASSACTLGTPSDKSDSKKPLGAKQPVAYIDSITPSQAAPGEEVKFTGHGTDVDGEIIGYEWSSDIDSSTGGGWF